MSAPFPAALPVARLVLKLLVVLNWIYAAIVLTILGGLFTNAHWTLSALGFSALDPGGPLLAGVRVIALIGLIAVPLNLIVLRRLLEIIGTVRAGDPFVESNAERLQAIAWAVLGQQILQLAVGLVARFMSVRPHGLHVGSFSTGGWLAVILLFVLARVFAVGTIMRDDLAGTV